MRGIFTLQIDNGALKQRLRCFNLHRSYSNFTFNLSNVDDFFSLDLNSKPNDCG